jgi:AraC family transcriptional regulator of adaptative response/methylated-DNA-[protein]-cysteine methyltransferase
MKPDMEQTDDRTIRFTAGPCAMGWLLAAMRGNRLCAVLIGDDEPALRDDLRRLFPRAILNPAGHALDLTLRRIEAAIDNPARGLDLPLDLRGTPFQQRVWTALRGIPTGQTRSYAEVARAIGAPKAVRAVAAACAANTLAVVVPCHRVVRSDGSLSGYRWGVARKRWLLERERSLALAA